MQQARQTYWLSKLPAAAETCMFRGDQHCIKNFARELKEELHVDTPVTWLPIRRADLCHDLHVELSWDEMAGKTSINQNRTTNKMVVQWENKSKRRVDLSLYGRFYKSSYSSCMSILYSTLLYEQF